MPQLAYISIVPLGILLGFILDMLLGDPTWMPHGIRGIGHLIDCGEKLFRKIFPERERLAGTLLVVFVLLIVSGICCGLVFIALKINWWLALLVQTIMCWQTLAARSLKRESTRVYDKIAVGDLQGARQAVSMIVGRDTKDLSLEQVTKAAVETVAENLSDGVIAPLLFLALGGGPAGMFYKAINTMDSMIGYKNDKYLYFGRSAAKLDDIVNYIPARISAWLMIAAARILGFDGKKARLIYKRDRYNHASPNSAHTEAACAGALGIQLAGNAFYFGKLYEKPTIGDPDRAIEGEDIPRTNRLMYGSAWLGLALALVVSSGIYMGISYLL